MSGSGDTIVAVATPPGRGGISVLRLSGPDVPEFARNFLGGVPRPRYAGLADFPDSEGKIIDHGIAVYFPAPNSYTGEHILELQAHGSPVVMQMLIQRCLRSGIRLARPGEFSERAFLNGRLDLAQAEAVADLIESSTEAAARSAFNSLKGEFSEKVHGLVEQVTELRMFVEAAIDFPDEEIDFLADGEVFSRLKRLSGMFDDLKRSVKLGRLLKEGLKVVLTGLPNAGKSSLLNRLANENRAIVSHIAGTTRDVLEQVAQIDGLPVEIVDTAGRRESADEIEARTLSTIYCGNCPLARRHELFIIKLILAVESRRRPKTGSICLRLPGQVLRICGPRSNVSPAIAAVKAARLSPGKDTWTPFGEPKSI